jgi:tetratricopeptide (TPR) repeat protein
VTSSLEYLRHIDRLLEQTGAEQPDRQVNLMFLKSAILFKNGMSDQADSLLKEIMATAVARQNSLYAGSAYHLLAESNLQASCFDKADFCGHKARAYYERTGRGTANTQDLLEILASCALLQNDTGSADRLLGEIASLKNAPDTAYSPQRYASVLAEHQLMRGDYTAARTLLLETRARMAPGDETWLSINTNLGIACYHLCDWEGLLTYDQAAVDSRSGRLAAVSQTNARLAVALHFLGRSEEAEQRFQTAEFNASQIRNDFELVDARRTLAEALLLRGQVERAEAVAREGASVGLRHAATYPVLTLLMILVETAVLEGDEEKARFFLSEADLLLERGVLVRRRDVLLYHYYHSALFAEDADSSRRAASEILGQEIECLGEDRFVEAFLATRRFRAVQSELMSTE